MTGVKAVVGWKPLEKKFAAAELDYVELPKVAAMDGSDVLKMVDALNRLRRSSFSAINLAILHSIASWD
ncbi:hypothetical protein TIFTF001_014246 [Ficus carica]|uniref:Uncharacterized protein n=1 Tax=Ficus carica TaxID=3494 RepID=A0AA87ZZ59_FICCA|nr:hypothetical protein TIFTF001_014246 [Ficus carica]